MNFTRSDLFYKDYSWSAASSGDNPFIIHGKEKKELNRREGYEVLLYVKKFAEESFPHQTINLMSYHKIERMIRESVPSHIHDRIQIGNWMRNNWNRL